MAILVHDGARPNGGLVRFITLARPDRRNALDADHLLALRAKIDAASQLEDVRAVVITSQGTAFCAGYDLTNPIASDSGAPDALVITTMAAVQSCPVPIIARVQGPAYGAGLHLAIACDLRIASDQASFRLPPARLGIAYAPEGLARLAALIGTSGARRMAFSGEVIQAGRAADLKLVDEVVAPELLDAKVDEVANAIADGAPMAVRAMKRTFNLLEARLPAEQSADCERDRLACYASNDAVEGLAAFIEKRAPLFRGH